MSRKALKVLVELKFRTVSCPGVHLPAKDDIYLSMFFMGQYRMSDCLPAVFPLLFHEKMTFEKIFRHAVDPGDIAVMLQYETVRIELVQLSPPVGDTLAFFEEDARNFLFPEPKLVPSFSGVEREVLMTRAPHFPGIAPRLEFSTKTTIIECPPDAQIIVYPNVSMRPALKRSKRFSGRPRTASRQKKQPQSLERRRSSRCDTSRSQSLSPLRTGITPRLAQLSLNSADSDPNNWDIRSASQSMLASWPGSRRSASPLRSDVFTSSSSPLTRSSSTVSFSATTHRKSLSTGLAERMSEDDSIPSETPELYDFNHGPDPSALWRSYREYTRGLSSSHGEWEQVHERVRGLLTTPKAVQRLHYGATVSEVDEVLARRSISPL